MPPKAPRTVTQPAQDPAAGPLATALGVTLETRTYQFGERPLFEALRMRLEPGETTCLLGPSGVGKSTLLRMVAGLTPAGAIAELGADDGRPLAGRVAYMAQQDLLLPWATVLDNVLLGFSLRREPADRARARAILARVGLGDRAGDRPAALSGGMRQRAALARTLMEDRPVVLMDEPFSALDALTRYRVQGLAAEVLAGRTVLLVTHDPNEALRLAGRIHVMAGRPARLDKALVLPGAAPRDPAATALRPLYHELMARLDLADRSGI